LVIATCHTINQPLLSALESFMQFPAQKEMITSHPAIAATPPINLLLPVLPLSLLSSVATTMAA